MALSDYLTSDEWDACFYYYMHPEKSFTSLGDAMHQVIEKLLAEGYVFTGLTEDGNKKEQIHSTGNPNKIMMFFQGAPPDEVIRIMNLGREFLKEHAPNLLIEEDEVWKHMITPS